MSCWLSAGGQEAGRKHAFLGCGLRSGCAGRKIHGQQDRDRLHHTTQGSMNPPSSHSHMPLIHSLNMNPTPTTCYKWGRPSTAETNTGMPTNTRRKCFRQRGEHLLKPTTWREHETFITFQVVQ